MLLKSKDGFM
ncbi:trypsin family protein, partial [Vibrio harveyi]